MAGGEGDGRDGETEVVFNGVQAGVPCVGVDRCSSQSEHGRSGEERPASDDAYGDDASWVEFADGGVVERRGEGSQAAVMGV
jgi:hypothetical protein